MQLLRSSSLASAGASLKLLFFSVCRLIFLLTLIFESLMEYPDTVGYLHSTCWDMDDFVSYHN